MDWINALVKEEKAVSLRGDGYPLKFTATATHLRTQLLEGPPCAKAIWPCGPNDILGPGWRGKTFKNLEELAACAPDEWLVIEAWDES